jgi:hypothetical protein
VIAVSRSLSILLAAGLLLVGSLAFAGPVGAAVSPGGPTTTCDNGLYNTGGLGLICETTITNTITGTGGSSKIVVRECHGAAGAPAAACAITTRFSTKLVTSVNQCNGSINGGGGTLRCSVKVTNRFVNMKTGATAATVNECNGSGASGAIGTTIVCDPFPATTTGATVTQCNGSANGGTLVGLHCSATGTKPSSHGVKINQCNDSANGGGAMVICSASISNIRVASAVSPGSTPGPTPPDTASMAAPGTPESNQGPLVLFGVLVMAFVVAATRLSLRRIRTRN